MARLMLSAGMFSALAATIAPRRRGFESGSPPPFFAAILISLMRRVKILPRLASSAPFLCLIVAHFEWRDMSYRGADLRCARDAQPCEFSMFDLWFAWGKCIRPPLQKVCKVFETGWIGLDFGWCGAPHHSGLLFRPTLCAGEVCQVFRLFSQRLPGNRRSAYQMT